MKPAVPSRIAADTPRPTVWTAGKAFGASPLWQGRRLDWSGWFPDTRAEAMRTCGANLEAGNPRTAGFQPAPSARLWRNEFRAPGGGLPPRDRAELPRCSPSSKISPNRKNLSPNRSNSNFNAIQAFIKLVQAFIKPIQASIKTVLFAIRSIQFCRKNNLFCGKQNLLGFFLISCSFHPFSRFIP